MATTTHAPDTGTYDITGLTPAEYDAIFAGFRALQEVLDQADSGNRIVIEPEYVDGILEIASDKGKALTSSEIDDFLESL